MRAWTGQSSAAERHLQLHPFVLEGGEVLKKFHESVVTLVPAVLWHGMIMLLTRQVNVCVGQPAKLCVYAGDSPDLWCKLGRHSLVPSRKVPHWLDAVHCLGKDVVQPLQNVLLLDHRSKAQSVLRKAAG